MNLNVGNSSKLSILKCCHHKKSSSYESVDKENIEQENKMLGADIVRNVTCSSLSNSKGRKSSDNSFDRIQQLKGLQELDLSINNQGAIPKRRNHSTSDTYASKPFIKPCFTVFDDRHCNQNNVPNGKTTNIKTDKTKKSTKSLGLRENVRNNVNTKESTGKSVTSPENLPQIQKLELSKIKEEHRKALSVKKPQKVVYDILSLELAYNIDYMSEYVQFQMETNEKRNLSSTFLTKSITPDQRSLVVKYLIRTSMYFKYPSFVVYQAVKTFDSYIDVVDVSVHELQTVALAAFWISLKKDLIINDIPDASAIIQLAGDVFQGDKKPLIECEKKILMTLNFEISFPEPFSLLALSTILLQEVQSLSRMKLQDLYYCGCYLIDLSLLHDKMFNITALHLAVISAEIALVLITTSNENLKNPQWNHWRNRIHESNPIVKKYCLPDEQINYIRNQMLQMVMLSQDSKNDFNVVCKKYSSKRYGPVSRFMISKVSSLYIHRIVDTRKGFGFQPIIF